MPLLLTPGTTLVKTWAGVAHTVVATETGFEMAGASYPSLMACAKAICGSVPRGLCTRSFFSVRPETVVGGGPTRRAGYGTAEQFQVKGKCQREGCYEPADCKHGFCKDHCHRHEIGSYSSRSYPRTSDLHVGVEIEVNYPCAETFRRGVGIDCHRDGSLGSYGAEYKLLAKSTRIVQEATELVQELWKRRARVDRKCGVHVHLDVRQLSRVRVDELLRWLRETQEVWFGLVPPSRRNNHYIKRIEANEYLNGHYTWANPTSYDTVEIRLHGGTLNPYKLAGWLTAMIHVQAKANDASYAFPSTGDAEADFWAVFADCPAAGKEYLATRKANGGVIRDNAYGHIEE